MVNEPDYFPQRAGWFGVTRRDIFSSPPLQAGGSCYKKQELFFSEKLN